MITPKLKQEALSFSLVRALFREKLRGMAKSAAMNQGMGLRRVRRSELSETSENSLVARPKQAFGTVRDVVDPIMEDVRSNGDTAVLNWSSKLDNTRPDPLLFHVAGAHFEVAGLLSFSSLPALISPMVNG